MRGLQMGDGGVGVGEIDPPLPVTVAFFRLFRAVVAGLAQALQVLVVPEQRLGPAMRDDVVSDELRCVGL